MRNAITLLETALDVAEAGEVIARKENLTAQADLQAKNAAELRQALGLLRAHIVFRDPVYLAPEV